MTIKKARKILGNRSKKYSDDEVKQEIEMAVYLAELVMKRFKKQEQVKV